LRKVYIILLCKSESEGKRAGAGFAVFARPVTDRSCLIIQYYQTCRTKRLYAMCSDRDMMNLQEQLLLAGGHIRLGGLSSQVAEPAMLFGRQRPEKTDHTLPLYNRAGLRAYNQVLLPLLKPSLSKDSS